MSKQRKIASILVVIALVAVGVWFKQRAVWGFTGPTLSPGVGGGAVGVDPAGNLSVGTSTPNPTTRFLVVASSTSASSYALQILQPGGAPVFVARNDGSVGIGTASPGYTLDIAGDVRLTGTIAAASYAGMVVASNVSAGVFGEGNFAFPSSVGVATTTQVGLPQSLSVYGGGYFGENVGIGIASPGQKLEVAGNVSSTQLCLGGSCISAWSAAQWSNGSGGAIYYNSGNVGIGTASPGYKLDVSGTANFSQPIIVGTPTAGNHAATKSYVDAAVGSTVWDLVAVANSTVPNTDIYLTTGYTVPDDKQVLVIPRRASETEFTCSTSDDVAIFDGMLTENSNGGHDYGILVIGGAGSAPVNNKYARIEGRKLTASTSTGFLFTNFDSLGGGAYVRGTGEILLFDGHTSSDVCLYVFER